MTTSAYTRPNHPRTPGRNRMILQAVLFTSLLLAARGAEEVEASGECFIKGVEGSFAYDPTSGKGPMDWGNIEGFELCGTGQAQSPIDFPLETKYAPLDDGPKPSMMVAEMELSASSFNWALNCPEGADCGSTEFKGTTFNLINLHFHSPSEHTLNGTQFPLEAHMVHISPDGQLAVIATMFEYVDEDYQYEIYSKAKLSFGQSPMFNAILKNLKKNRSKFPVFLGSVIDANKGYCTYVGSLTTPPCSEGVTFLMSNNVKMVTRRQVSDFLLSTGAGFVDGNNRPVQPRNGRDVTCYIL